MTDLQTPSTPPPEKVNWRLIARGVLLLGLLALCGFGLAATPFWKQNTLDYWLWVVPCFGAASILLCMLSESKRHTLRPWAVVRHQALHWLGTGAAVFLLFWLVRQKFFNVEAAGVAVTLLLALSLFLAGITFDWTLVVVAVLLGAMAVGAVYLERVALIVVGMLVILAVAFLLIRPVVKNLRHRPATDIPPTPPPIA
ncbi:MAG TPA: hypothetical protein VLH81_07350 [Desulfobacterales bacterium]|nr:hypothetical protein [Desulfobacterales bacterium]